jgi:hypothetical protein
MLCIFDNGFWALNQRNAPPCAVDTYNITRNFPASFGPQGAIINESNESNTAQNQISQFSIQPAWCVMELNV